MKLDNIIAVRKGKTIYRDKDMAIKVFDSNFSKSDVLNEALNHARVEESGLCVPSIRGITMFSGKWAILMDYIEGETLDNLMLKDPSNIDKYLDLFVELQLKMHSYKAPLLNKLRDKMERKINESKLNATIRYELHTKLNSMPKHTKLCHGDFNPSNIIIQEDGSKYIIDWSHATQGNASADAARTYLLFKLAGSDDIAEKYIKLFLNKSDTARQYVEKWFPIVAASQSVKGNVEEREFLLKWVDVVEYE